MFLVIEGCDGEFRISLRDPRVKKCRKCVLEVGCIGKTENVDLECMEFVTVGFFFSFFPGDGKGEVSWSNLIFQKIVTITFPVLPNKISCFTIYVARWHPFFKALPIGHSLHCTIFSFCYVFFSLVL